MKKMRKLIPAFAMLMVAAIMMTTASFAWFTMNESVTATGMQVQAKASGNLLISKDKMTSTSNGIEVDFGGTKTNLVPITYKNGWYEANGKKVDPTYGTALESDWTSVSATATADNHFAEYAFYLATAGDTAITGNLQFDLEAVVNADAAIAPAYTVAIYTGVVDGKTKADIDWNAPAKTFSQFENLTATGFVDTGVEVTVPSTYGKAADTAVGLLVVVRIYVDGALPNPDGAPVEDKKNIQVVGEDMKYDAEAHADYTFYTDVNGTQVYPKDNLQNGQVISNVAGYYYIAGDDIPQPNAPATFVNNNTVPAAGTSFEITFKVASNA